MNDYQQREDTDLDRVFDDAAKEFCERIGSLASGPVLRAALVGPALASVVLALENEFPDCLDVIQDELEKQSDIMKIDARDKARATG